MKIGQIKRPLLVFCLITSALVHLGAVWLLYRNPFHFESDSLSAVMKPSPDPQIIPKDQTDLIVEKMERALEQSLNSAVAMTKLPGQTEDLARDTHIQEDFTFKKSSYTPPEKTLFASSPKIRKKELSSPAAGVEEFSANMPPPFDPEFKAEMSDFAFDDDLNEELFAYESEKYASIDFSDHRFEKDVSATAQIIEDDYTLTDQQFSPSALPIHKQDGLAPDFVSSLKKLKTQAANVSAEEMTEEKMFSALDGSTAPKLILPNSVDYLRAQWIKRSLAERTLPDLDYYGLSEIATTVEWEEEIDADISVMPAAGDNKYVFSITFHPDFQVDAAVMRQNFYFVIDRSSSIEKHKFSRFKRAVQRSLAALREGDNFNIYIFDKNVSKLSERTLPVTPKTIQMAEDFLERQNSKTHFAATEVYSSLEKMLPSRYDPDELHSVILITDGNTLLSSSKQKKVISQWLEKYEGSVNFYAAAAGKGNNLVLLDLLSYTTAGNMLYSDTNAGFPRKLVRLIKELHSPIVKNISIDAQPFDSQARVALYPKTAHLPPMFAEKPYTIVGTIDELCDITLYIQGRNHDQWLNIRKNISFRDSVRNSRALEKLWATTQSRICYDHFLKNGKTTHLKEAVQIVAPYRGVIASDQ